MVTTFLTGGAAAVATTELTQMIDKLTATSLTYRTTLHHSTLKNADGTPLRCRVNGKCKLWKTRPTEFRLPVKHGLKNCFYIDQDNADEWSVGEGY